MFGFPSIFSYLPWNALFQTELKSRIISWRAGLFPMCCLVYTSHCNVSLSTTSEHFWLVFNNGTIKSLDELLKHGYTLGGSFWWFFFSPSCIHVADFFLKLVTTGFHTIFFSIISSVGYDNFCFSSCSSSLQPTVKFHERVLSSLLKSWKYWAHLDSGQRDTGKVLSLTIANNCLELLSFWFLHEHKVHTRFP